MRRQFFRSEVDPQELSDNAVSLNSSTRWAAAIELGEIPEDWSVKLLWLLKDDGDEYVRQAASSALSGFDHKLLEQALSGIESADKITRTPEIAESSEGGILEHVPWKTRPLDPPDDDNTWASTAVIIDIVNTEGPLTGARLLRLYGESVYPNAPRKLSRSRVERAVKATMRRGIVSKSFADANDYFESWILHRTGTPEVFVRTRGSRKLSEIPVTEVEELVRQKAGRRHQTLNQNRRFAILMDAYQIPQNEFHLVGAALEKEWSALLTQS